MEAYSNCGEVELLLNGRSLGKKLRNADDSPRIWKAAWEQGTLVAIGRNGGSVVARHELRTAGALARIRLTADKTRLAPSWEDVAFITATIVDQNGIPVPDASNLVSFKITGPGTIAAVDNGDNASVEPFHASERHAYQGSCLAMIRATAERGKITITASAPGLIRNSICVTTEATPRNWEIRAPSNAISYRGFAMLTPGY